MIVRNGPNEQTLRAIIHAVSVGYSDNLTWRDTRDMTNSRATITRFTLRVHSSRGPGAHQSSCGYNGKRRRGVAACWHAHRDVLRAIFTRYPNAKVKSAFATYDGLDGFLRTFPATYDRNAGSAAYPVCYGDLCECDDADDMSEHTLGVDRFDLVPVGAHRYVPSCSDPRYQAAEDEMLSWREFIESMKKDA